MGAFIDITGNKYGRLTVIKRAENQGKKPMWLCKCECGNQKIIRSDSLKNGSIKSCGCLLKETVAKRHFIDLTGKKIGKWTILKRIENHNKNIVWECKCECGTIRNVYANGLLNGLTQSCGCYKNKIAHEMNFIDITGQTFGLLKVIKRVDDKLTSTSKKYTQWLCECECGNQKIISGGSLRSGGTKSCGCLNISFGEYLIKKILNKLNVKYETEYKFNDCKDILPLPFDFYIPNNNICIEYDGLQHFKAIDFFGGENTFKKQKKHDKIKNEYCKNNNITLLRIPYYINYKQIEHEIINILNP